MNINESVAKLQTLLPNLKASDANFASSLIASFNKYGKLTPRQAPWIEKLIVRATPAVFSPSISIVNPAPVVAVNVGSFANVIALFATAKAHLKFPKVRLSVDGKKVVLSLNGAASKAPGAVSITSEGAFGNRSYYGRVSVDGTFTPANACYGAFLTGLTNVLTALATNPARVAKEHGKLTGNCCFCNKALGLGEDKRSVLVGFGPVCADHYGLKAEWLSGVAKAEAKADFVTAVETLTAPVAVTPAPVAEVASETLAESLKTCTGAVEVTVTETVVVPESAQEPVTCFFCEKPSTETKVVLGYNVCPSCKSQLAAA